MKYYKMTPSKTSLSGCNLGVKRITRIIHMSLVMRKPAFFICENKDADQLRGTAKLISAFIFATRIVQSLYYIYLNPKFQASSHLLRL